LTSKPEQALLAEWAAARLADAHGKLFAQASTTRLIFDVPDQSPLGAGHGHHVRHCRRAAQYPVHVDGSSKL
jgi:hypothetical protein